MQILHIEAYFPGARTGSMILFCLTGAAEERQCKGTFFAQEDIDHNDPIYGVRLGINAPTKKLPQLSLYDEQY